jgi:hypothetical protein
MRLIISTYFCALERIIIRLFVPRNGIKHVGKSSVKLSYKLLYLMQSEGAYIYLYIGLKMN